MGSITIAGGKGGVGKSTTAASLARVFHEGGAEVALVDADLAMANLADIVGVESETGLHHVLAGEAAVDDAVVQREAGPDLVPGSTDVELFRAADPSNLRRVLDPLEAAYDLVVVDTGAGLGHEALVATGLADVTLLVTTPDDAAVADVAKTAEFVDHADASVHGAVVTRAEAGTDLAAVADGLGVPIAAVVPEDADLGTGPVTSGVAGRAYRSLAATLLASCAEVSGATVDASAGLAIASDDEASSADAKPAEPEASDAGVETEFSFGD